MLTTQTTNPTIIIKIFGGIFLQSSAAKGAAKSPPTTSPATLIHGLAVTKIVKKPAVESVKKNSAKLTEPIVERGSCPFPSKFVVTIGPHPPPPAESTKPPKNASFPIFEVLLDNC